MLGLLTIELEAHNPAANHHRSYALAIGRDLFGAWTVTIAYGRTGTAGHVQILSAATEAGARQLVHARLRRRLSAPRRIGCPYHLIRLEGAQGLTPTDWLPQDMPTLF